MLRSLIAAVLMFGSSGTLASVTAFGVNDPRAFGYFLGDKIVRVVTVETDGVTKLQTAALPRPGSLNYWLDLTAVDHQERSSSQRTVHTITLTYQMFYAALEPKQMAIPAVRLSFTDAGQAPDGVNDIETKVVPVFAFLMSPLRQIMTEKVSDPQASPLLGDAPATLLATGRLKTAALASLLALAATIAGLAWHYALGPFGKRKYRPFTVAYRELTRVVNRLPDSDKYQAGLLTLHRAIDAAGGCRILSGDLEAFVRQHPEFTDLKDALTAFFESSNVAFFAENPAEANRIFNWDALLQLTSALAREERGSA